MAFFWIKHRLTYKTLKHGTGCYNPNIPAEDRVYREWGSVGHTADKLTIAEANRLSEEYMQRVLDEHKDDPTFELLEKMNHTETQIQEYKDKAAKEPTMADLVRLIFEPDEQMMARYGFDSLLAKARGWMKKHDLMDTCSRCGGTGNYSYNQIDGTRCFKCRGAKVTMPRITKKLWIRIIEAKEQEQKQRAAN